MLPHLFVTEPRIDRVFCLWIVTAETSIASSSRLVCCTATSSDVVEGFSKTVVIVRPTERLVTELSTSEIVSELAVSDEVTYVPVDGVGVTVQMYVNVSGRFTRFIHDCDT